MAEVTLPDGLLEHLAAQPVGRHLDTPGCSTGRCSVCRANDEATVLATLDYLREHGWRVAPPEEMEVNEGQRVRCWPGAISLGSSFCGTVLRVGVVGGTKGAWVHKDRGGTDFIALTHLEPLGG